MSDKIEYIQKPDWINYEYLIARSKNILSFILVMGIRNLSKLSDLNNLRDYYRKDKKSALILIDELALRGFRFASNKKNSILPKHVLQEPIMCIVVNGIINNFYRKIDFEKLGFVDFLDRFQVSSDEFFDGIPIQTFKYLNESVNLDLIEETFLNAGFKICDIALPINKTIVSDFEKEADAIKTAIYTQNKVTKKNNAAYSQQKMEDAKNNLTHKIRLDPTELDKFLSKLSLEELIKKSDEMEQKRKYNKAAQLVNNELIKRGVKATQYYLRLAKCYADRNMIDEAIEIYNKILSFDRHNKDAKDYIEIYGKGLYYQYQEKPFDGVYRDVWCPPPELEVIIEKIERDYKASKKSQKESNKCK